jgi:HK97 family phage portal protein
MQRKAGGGLIEVTSGSATDALASLSWQDMNACVFDACARGNGWLRLDGGTLTALDDARTGVFIDSANRIFVRDFVGTLTPYERVGHIKGKHVPHYVRGVNVLLYAQSSLKSAIGITELAGAMAKNAATPSGVIHYPGVVSDEAATNIRHSWEQVTKGEAAGGVPILEEGMTYERFPAPSAADAQLVEALQWSVSEIARMYGVPNSLLNLTDSVTRATAAEESRQFFNRALKPWASRVSDVLSRLLLTDAERRQGQAVQFDLSELALGIGRERAEYVRALVLSSVVTPNEARNSLQMEDIEGGDQLLSPVNVMPIDQLGNGNAGPT